MVQRGELDISGSQVGFAFSSREDGDFSITRPIAELEPLRSPLAMHEWTWLNQVHSADVVVVSTPGQHCGEAADAAVTSTPGAVVAVQTADCAPLLFAAPCATTGGPIIGAAHAGWKGLYDGVVESTVSAMVDLGAELDRMWVQLGPCISAEAYEFSESDLATMALRFGPDVVAATPNGRPAFDLRSAVRSVLRSCRIDVSALAEPPCTATTMNAAANPEFYSWRRRADVGRQTSAIWIEP